MRGAFTLLELMTVVALMGLLGSLSAAAWGAMRRNQADRLAQGALECFVQTAADVAKTEETTVALVFRTHEIAEDADFDKEKVCRAFAVRPVGRVSKLEDGHPWDEFADEGPVRLDEGEPAFSLVAGTGDWKVGDPYGRAFSVLELPRGYWVDDGVVTIVPAESGTATVCGSLVLKKEGRAE